VADKAIAMEIGARGMRSVMESIMTDLMFSVPSDDSIERIVITADVVITAPSP
jgi:ATP-dependent Clp protease ATP-binding subunit ClpX